MKKILLFADIGGHEYQKYYHVGDEAMFYETYRWYKSNHPTYKLTALSWFTTHQNLDLIEKPHLHWSTYSYTYFPLLLITFIVFKITSISFFSSEEMALVKTIQQQDRIHFCGGGNLSSTFRQWLYYCFFVIIVAKFSRTEIILTSQTIGPITGIDRLFSLFILNLPKVIAIRANTNTWQEFKRYGAFLPNIKSMLDAAYSLPLSKIGIKNLKRDNIIVGLSIHKWKDSEKETLSLIKKVLQTISKKYHISIVLIPHHINESEEGTDIQYMKEVVNTLPEDIIVYMPESSTKNNLAEYIKKITSQTDILLTSRYHGLIFGLSANIPTIALNFDEYYQMKNEGALELFFKDKTVDYQINLNNQNAGIDLHKKMTYVLDNLSKEKRMLQSINKTLSKTNLTLHSVLHNLESTS